MRKLFLLVLLLFASAVTAQAACTGSSPNLTAPTWADVQACHTAAAGTGDIITVTAGSYNVTVRTDITKFVKIRCAVALTCDLTDNVADVDDLILITESTAGSTRLEGFEFIQGTGQHLNPNGVIRTVYTTNGLPILISTNVYTNPVTLQGDFMIFGTWRGVVWGNTATGIVGGGTCQNTGSFLRNKNTGLTGVWTEGPYYGMADSGGNKNLYIEGNTIINMMEGIDIDANGRAVVRYNTITNSQVLNHGADTGSIAGRYIDIYNNKFIWDNAAACGSDPVGFGGFIYLRGAPALIHDNTIADVTSMTWGDKSEVNFYDEKLRRNAGPWACWTGGYPSPYQVGWGYSVGGTQAGTSGVFQDLEPVYLWSNTGAGNYGAPNVGEYSPNECGGSAHTVADYIQVNRDYYLATAKTGYTAYNYPHPLATLFGAKTIYVNKAGSDGNSCTTAQSATDSSAKLTVAGGLSCIASGDTLIIGNGSYAEVVVNAIPNGSASGQTIIKAENRNLAIIQAQDPGDIFAIGDYNGSSYITIDGIVADGNNQEGLYAMAFYNSSDQSTVHHIIVQNGTVKNAGSGPADEQRGVGILMAGVGNQVLNIDAYDNTSHGIYVNGTDGIYDGNRTHDNGDGDVKTYYGIHAYFTDGGIDGNIIRNNVSYNNRHYGALLSSGSDNQFYNNIVYGNPTGGILLHYGITNQTLYFNTIYGNGTCVSNFDSSATIARNNICWANGTNTISETGGAVTDSNNLFTDPGLPNAAIGEFHPSHTSAALGAGTAIAGITTDKDGVIRPNPPAIGAYEIPSGIDPTGPLSEDFDAYTTGASICGLNDGTGFTSSWICTTGVATIETAPAGMSGKALRLTSTSDVILYRLFTAKTGAFTITFKMRLSITDPNNNGIGVNMLDPSGVAQSYAYFYFDGNIYSNSQVLSAFMDDTNYTVDVDFDTAAHPNEFRTRINGGAYSSWEDCFSTCTSIAGINVNSFTSNTHTFWLDEITDDVGAGTITNVTPLAGAVCTSGSTCPISWGSNGITGAVNVYYLVNGQSYFIAAPDVTATPYTWTVNAPAGTTIKTRVSQGAVSSDSGEFTVRGTKAVFR